MKICATTFSIFCITILWTSCVEMIEFDPPVSLFDAIAIQAKLTKGNPSSVNLSVQEVFDFQSLGSFLSLKKVFIEDEKGNQLELNSRSSGVYNIEISEDHPTFSIDYGRKYRMIILFNEGDKIISDYDEIFPVTKPDSLVVKKEIVSVPNRVLGSEERTLIKGLISTPTKTNANNTGKRFLWEVNYTKKVTDTPEAYSTCCGVVLEKEKKACYITEIPARNSIVYDASIITSDRIEDVEVYSQIPNFLLAEGFYLNVFQHSVSKKAFEYWKQVSSLSIPSGDVFQEPVGRIITNFTNIDNPDQEIYGFFFATETEVIRRYISPEFAEYPMPSCPSTTARACPDPVCCNCSTVENSLVEKPEWWIE